MVPAELLLHIVLFGFINLILALLSYVLVKHKQALLSWLLLVLSVGTVYYVFLKHSPVLLMLTVIATTFTAVKPIVAIADVGRKPFNLTFKPWLAFALGWAGMRVGIFKDLGNFPLPNASPKIVFGASRLVIGLLIILAARQIASSISGSSIICIMVSVLLLVGLSFTLHFGLLSISAGMWRLRGVNTDLLFKAPYKSISLTEFWGKRWNLAFIEMAAIAVYRPLKARLGASGALMCSFIFSGLLHELALSLPVNSGYGLPTLYFLIQGFLILIEKKWMYAFWINHHMLGRAWTWFWIIAPAPLLFHIQFIKQVVWPLCGLSF